MTETPVEPKTGGWPDPEGWKTGGSKPCSASALGSFECGALSVGWRIRVVVQIEFGNSAKAKSEFGLGVSLGINWSRVKAAADEWVLEKP